MFRLPVVSVLRLKDSRDFCPPEVEFDLSDLRLKEFPVVCSMMKESRQWMREKDLESQLLSALDLMM